MPTLRARGSWDKRYLHYNLFPGIQKYLINFLLSAIFLCSSAFVLPAMTASEESIPSATLSLTESAASEPPRTSSSTVSVTVGPSSRALRPGESATFVASVTGTTNTAVIWSLSPAVGTVVNGLYTAPATIGSAQSVTITAKSVADSTKTASASIALTPAASPGPITIPVEVIGPNGTTVSVPITIPSGSSLSGQMVLYMRIHGLRSQSQASVQMNNSAWIPVSSSTVRLLGNAAAYGGIGGGFSTLKMVMNLPAGSVQIGTNTVSFRFNQTDGRVSGFRVLEFNVLTASGSALLPESTFVNTNPSTWQPPSTNPSDIAAGETLWHQAALTTPLTTGGSKAILAHCSDCHTQDGRDLKYFNYSNNSIEARALFHGLTAQAGNADCQLHSKFEPGLPRAPVESALSAWPGPGFTALGHLGGGRRSECRAGYGCGNDQCGIPVGISSFGLCP